MDLEREFKTDNIPDEIEFEFEPVRRKGPLSSKEKIGYLLSVLGHCVVVKTESEIQVQYTMTQAALREQLQYYVMEEVKKMVNGKSSKS